MEDLRLAKHPVDDLALYMKLQMSAAHEVGDLPTSAPDVRASTFAGWQVFPLVIMCRMHPIKEPNSVDLEARPGAGPQFGTSKVIRGFVIIADRQTA